MLTIKFFTLGCKVNQYDTQSMRERFTKAGFKEISNGKKSDVYLINTCTVTQRADAESLNLIHRAYRENPLAKVMVTGCLTELNEQKISQINKKIIIFKNRAKDTILNHLSISYEITKQRNNETTNRGISNFAGHTRAFLKIQDGCDNFCSYCKVPLVRGRPRSRRLEEIVAEAERLVKNGFKEIVLSGICLGAYGKDLPPILSLLNVIEELEKIDGLLRIRLSSIEAGDVTDELIEKMADSKKLCRHLHIPIQSGNDEILQQMNRHYTPADYLNLIQKIRKYIPEIAITTDILAGFPGETEAQFQNTINLVKQIMPLKVHIFPYSIRAGTKAAELPAKLAPIVIKERMKRLKKIADACAVKYKSQFLGRKMPVLIEGRVKDGPGYWRGHTDNYLEVIIKSERNLKNQLILLKLRKIQDNFMAADLN